MKQEFTAHRGTKVKIVIPTGKTGFTANKAPEESRTLLHPARLEDDLFVFRKKNNLGFFDLATRLRSALSASTFDGLRVRLFESQETTETADDRTSEYIELLYEATGTFSSVPAPYGTLTILDSEHNRLDRMLLGSLAPSIDGHPDDVVDPTGFSAVNGSGRMVANCQEVPLAFLVNGEFILESDFDVRESKPEDADERWNPDNLYTSSGNIAQFQKKFKQGLADRLKGHPLSIKDFGSVANQEYFHFDTADLIHFKVTASPTYESDEVDFQMDGNESIYLRPILGIPRSTDDVHGTFIGFVLTSSTFPFPVIARWAMRHDMIYPVSPTLQSGCQTSAMPVFNVVDSCRYLRSELSNLRAFITANPSGHVTTNYNPLNPLPGLGESHIQILNVLPVGALVAIIRRANERFFIWRRTAVNLLEDE